MKGHGAKYPHKRERAIAALLSQRSVEAAARATGIGVNTLLRWMQQPEFEAMLREARRADLSQAIGRFRDAVGAAVTTVLKIMVDQNASAGARLRAAEIVLEQAAKRSEMEAIEDRVAKLERRAGSARKSRKRSADLTWLSPTPPGPVTTLAQIAAPGLDSAETDEDVVE
jgi:transposase-like protein